MSAIRSDTAALVLCMTVAIVTFAQAAPRKHSVEMEITLQNGAVPRVTVPEREGASVRLPGGRRFGFVPTVRGGNDAAAVIVTIWDVDKDPSRQLGRVEVEVNGPPVRSDTIPSFAIRVSRVIRPK